MTKKRKSKSSVVRAKARRQRQPVPPPVVPKPPSPDTTPAAPPASAAPKPPTPAPSPVVAPKVTPTPAPSPVAPKAPAQWKGWVVLVAVIVGIVFFAASLVNRSRQQVAQATPTAKVAAAAPTVKSTAMPVATSTQAPATSSYEVVPGVALGQCTTKATREERLDCATALYFANGEKLSGIKAYFYALEITWTDLKVGDPFQPDANPLPSGSPRIWGALVKGTNVTVTGNACLVTDVPIRIASFKWTFLDTRYAPRPTVGHYGEAVSVVNQLVELAIHGDCSDWSEIRQAAQAAGYTLK